MNKILDLETFSHHVEEATRRAGFAVEKCDGEHLYVKLSGLSQRFGLDMLYNIYQAEPNRLDTIIDSHINVLSNIPEAATHIIEPDSLQGLLPLLQQKRWLKKTEERGVGPLTHKRLVTGVVITYVFDFPEYRTYLNHAREDRTWRE